MANKKSKNCPQCGWKYPPLIAPGKRRHNAKFNCPSCDTALIYKAGKARLLSWFFILATPLAGYFMWQLDDDPQRQGIILGIVVLLMIPITVFYYGQEYIEHQ